MYFRLPDNMVIQGRLVRKGQLIDEAAVPELSQRFVDAETIACIDDTEAARLLASGVELAPLEGSKNITEVPVFEEEADDYNDILGGNVNVCCARLIEIEDIMFLGDLRDYEADTKGRKTVLNFIDERMAVLAPKPVEADPTPEEYPAHVINETNLGPIEE